MPSAPTNTVIVVSDSHLGAASAASTAAFHEFLTLVPNLGDHLVINGDLFDFWFEYRSVIPRAAFQTLVLLRRVRDAGVAITLTGGNHDRWGGKFFEEELGAAFHPDGAELRLAGWRTWLAHGDGLVEQHWGGRLLHRVTRHALTVRAFRAIHPDLGFRLTRWMSPALADHTRDHTVLDRAAAAQASLARKVLAERPELDLVILGHTHRALLEPVGQRRWYLNPGAWMDGQRYAVVTSAGPELRTFP
jgi:UDP-2,3-diacylglucosamine hydrolase